MANVDIFERMADHYNANDQRIATMHLIAQEIAASLDAVSSNAHAARNATPSAGDAATPAALDFGCGTGVIGCDVATQVATLDMVDASAAMIDVTNERIASLGVTNAQTYCIDIEHGGTLPHTYDVIWISQTLLHMSDTAATLRVLCGALKPNGQLIVVDFDPVISDVAGVHHGFSRPELADALSSLGMYDISFRTIYEADNLLLGQHATLFLLSALKAHA
ncbi:MAG: class I SAM-dependent methyltransferase [Atopobiaceae bacterium]|jgi:2-polyprenyl-3-methyl-5-hydroxy-6-metoxy-1,4-benzoquinol methylase